MFGKLLDSKTMIRACANRRIVSFNNIQIRRKSGDDNYNYLPKSIIPTHTFVKSLPRLPIPALADTCSRYLESLRPLIEDNVSYEKTVKIVKDFEKNDGLKYHNLIVEEDKRNKHTSYITGPWFDMYLTSRTRLPVNFNVFLAWKDEEPEYNDPIVRASNYVISSLRFRRSLNENLLAPEIFHMNPKKSDNDFYKKVIKYSPSALAFYVSALFKAFPLDMSQYKNLMSSTRIPQLKKDLLQTYPDSKHILVLKGGKFYTFDVLDANGDIKQPEIIYSALQRISKIPDTAEDSIGVFTTMDRDKWAELRSKLIEKQINAESINAIDSAITVVCLDPAISGAEDESKKLIRHAHNLLHGFDRSRPLNRWFDKSFSLIFTKDGHAAINFEHSWGDGVAVLRYFNEVFADSHKNHFVTSQTKVVHDFEVRELKFDLDPSLKDAIKSSKEDFRKLTEDLDLDYLLYEKINRNYFKSKGLGPDAMFQLAFQMAFYKCHNGKTPVTYEACSTAAFKHGRTETVRPPTMHTKKACELIHNSKSSSAEILSALDAVSKSHFTMTKNAAMGKGFDRHLFAIKYKANSLDNRIPDLFTDPNYIYATHYVLSTSTLYGDTISGGGFGPVVPDGYGLGYGYFGKLLGVFCSAYKSKLSSREFLDAFHLSLDQLYDITQQKK